MFTEIFKCTPKLISLLLLCCSDLQLSDKFFIDLPNLKKLQLSQCDGDTVINFKTLVESNKYQHNLEQFKIDPYW